MQALAIVFTALNAVVFLTLSIYRKAKDFLHDAEIAVKDESCRSLRDFGKLLLNSAVEEEQLENSIGRLGRTFFSGHADLHLIRRYSWELLCSIIAAFFGFVASLSSLAISIFMIKPNVVPDGSRSFFVLIAFIILIVEVFLLCRTLFVEDRAKGIKDKYLTRGF
jgi:hypothetical protein